jgi:hypothetical protein
MSSYNNHIWRRATITGRDDTPSMLDRLVLPGQLDPTLNYRVAGFSARPGADNSDILEDPNAG